MAGLLRGWLDTDVLFLTVLALFLATGITDVKTATQGFANEGLLIIAGLFIIVGAVEKSRIFDYWALRFFSKEKGGRISLLKIILPTFSASIFLNNTPLVALLTPIVRNWANRSGFSPAKFLMPMSFAATMGGLGSIVGTSTNLVVLGYIQNRNLPPFSFFEIGFVGIPLFFVGAAYFIFWGFFRLPERPDPGEAFLKNTRGYLVSFKVGKRCLLINKSMKEVSLQNLKGVFLVEVVRNGVISAPVSLDWVFHSGDVLIFAGAIDRIFDLQSVYGLSHIAESDSLPLSGQGVKLWEAVTSKETTVNGQTIRDSNFRSFYNGNILAVHRNGESLHSRLGDIRIMPGDTLLILAKDDFYTRWNNSHEFSLVAEALVGYDNKQKQKFSTAVPLIILGAVIVGGIFTASIAVFAFIGVAILLLGRNISPAKARSMLDLKVLLTIAGGIGLAGVLEKSGFAERVIRTLFQILPEHSAFISLFGVYFGTNILTSFITNNAAALISLPFALEAARQLNVSSKPFIVAVMVAASACFMTSIGYQANMIVASAAGYKERDFLRIGFPLTLIYGTFAIILIPLIWHF